MIALFLLSAPLDPLRVPLQVQESQSIVELIRSKITSNTGAAVFRAAERDTWRGQGGGGGGL